MFIDYMSSLEDFVDAFVAFFVEAFLVTFFLETFFLVAFFVVVFFLLVGDMILPY